MSAPIVTVLVALQLAKTVIAAGWNSSATNDHRTTPECAAGHRFQSGHEHWSTGERSPVVAPPVQ